MQRKIGTPLKANKQQLTAEVGNTIVSEMHKGDVKEAFQHLKRCYQKASEMQARPSHQMMERQTEEQVELYAEWDAYGEAFPTNGTPFTISNNQPSDSNLRTAVSLLSHDWCGGALGILVEYIKAWLRRAKKAENPKTAEYHVGEGKIWYEFVSLYSSLWAMGTIP
jgi:hypothetical protein